MTLRDFYNDYNVASVILESYNALDSKNPISLEEGTTILMLLINNIQYLMDCFTITEDYNKIANTITKGIRQHILSIVNETRILLKGLHNDNLQTIHTQSKFNPLDNSKDINEAPIFSDNINYKDIDNYLSKVNFLKDREFMSEWIRLNESVVLTY